MLNIDSISIIYQYLPPVCFNPLHPTPPSKIEYVIQPNGKSQLTKTVQYIFCAISAEKHG